jgi:ABC-type glycerol-3-phosphate transport system substrate-binding protein
VVLLGSLACAPTAPPAPAATTDAKPAATTPPPAAGAKPATKEVPAALKSAAKERKIVPFLTAESSPESVKQITDIIAEFEKANPDIGIELQLTSNDNRISRIVNAVATGEELGIFEIPRPLVPDLTQAGYLLQLDSIVNEIGIDKFIPGSLLYWPWDGHLYQFTSDLSAATLYWRQDLFQAAGLAEPDSYERILEASQKLHNQGGVAGNAIETSNGGSPTRFVSFLWQNGGDFYTRDGRLAFDRPGTKQAVEDYAALTRFAPAGNHSWGSLEPVSVYTAGRAAIALFPGRLGYVLGTNAPNIAKNTGNREARVARGGKGPRIVYGAVTSYSIGSNVRHPEEAKKFMMFMLTGDRLLKYAMGVPSHIAPALKDVQAQVLQQDHPYIKEYREWARLVFEATTYFNHEVQNMGSIKDDGTFDKSLVPMPWSSRVIGSQPKMATMFQRIALENVPVETAYNQAVEEHRTEMEKWKQENPGWNPPDPNWRPPGM